MRFMAGAGILLNGRGGTGVHETRLFQQRLSAGINHPIADGWVLGPGRNQPPAEQIELLSAIRHDNRRQVQWSVSRLAVWL